ncbi:hypothetical protein H3N34_03930 [Photobacterium damselae subsp. damselae]|uniref:hypothetical protein n=1 Tax=Photobacterium damselae TaxID=38293 RepID=UPI001592C976|nr:hypothetical protein [Photobacterium damselae]MBA5682367.1 hypothetical protein [Photobacterium damselae subsp. damselae]NVH52355.1 hypothetical protein [Photobacterium damselae subsp. damselae]NVO82863.1 hypothetical protein [Photobacterium damselae subsp. damselae]
MTLNIRNKREATFCWGYLCKTLNIFIERPNDYKKMKGIALQILDKQKPNDKNNIINCINLISSQYLLNEEQIYSLNFGSIRYINWLWMKIISSRNIFMLSSSLTKQFKNITPLSVTQQTDSNSVDIFSIYKLNNTPISTKEKKDIIIDFFDLSEVTKIDKVQILNNINNDWYDIETIDNFSWLNKNNPDLCSWALNYTNEHLQKNYSFYFMTPDVKVENDYYRLLLVFDTWNTHPDTKKLFIQSIKKAYAQKKFRDKQVGKKQCSFNLSQKSINQLALLSELQGVPKNHILESLINNKILELGVKQ